MHENAYAVVHTSYCSASSLPLHIYHCATILIMSLRVIIGVAWGTITWHATWIPCCWCRIILYWIWDGVFKCIQYRQVCNIKHEDLSIQIECQTEDNRNVLKWHWCSKKVLFFTIENNMYIWNTWCHKGHAWSIITAGNVPEEYNELAKWMVFSQAWWRAQVLCHVLCQVLAIAMFFAMFSVLCQVLCQFLATLLQDGGSV